MSLLLLTLAMTYFLVKPSAIDVTGIFLKEPDVGADAPDDMFTIAVLPDTQHYSNYYPWIFTNQTRWIAQEAARRNIAFVIHEGDIVDSAYSQEQWAAANASMSVLDGVVPYSIVRGNHDKAGNFFETYFPASRYAGNGWYGGSKDNNLDSYQTFSAAGGEYLVLSLDFCPGRDDIKWGNMVLKSNKDRKAILVTHGFLDAQANRRVNECGSTEYIWDELVEPNSNVFLVLSGHVHAENRRLDYVNGRKVHQVLADYQDASDGGQGWLRLLEFYPLKGIVSVRTYSPYLGSFKVDDESQFTLELN